MASEVRKVLGQAELAATTLTAVYAVPAGKQAVVSTVTVCNRTGGGLTYRLSVAVAGAADTNKQYLAYDEALAANATARWTIGMALGALDEVRAFASAVGISVSVFGVELTP